MNYSTALLQAYAEFSLPCLIVFAELKDPNRLPLALLPIWLAINLERSSAPAFC